MRQLYKNHPSPFDALPDHNIDKLAKEGAACVMNIAIHSRLTMIPPFQVRRSRGKNIALP